MSHVGNDSNLKSGATLSSSPSTAVSVNSENEQGRERGEGTPLGTNSVNTERHRYVTVPIVIRKASRRSRYQAFPTKVTIPLEVADVGRGIIGVEELESPVMVPTSDESLYQAIVERAGKVSHGYTSRKCSQCDKLGFRVCNKLFDHVCVFCQASGARCEFGLSKKVIKSRIKNTNFPREFFYDANRKMQRYIEGFTMSSGSSLHTSCGIIPKELCVDSDLLDAIHRSASYHCQVLQEWYGESLFEKLDSSALIAMGVLAEELVRDQLLGHLVPNEEDEHYRIQKAAHIRGIPEFRQNSYKAYARKDVSLIARIRAWNSQSGAPFSK